MKRSMLSLALLASVAGLAAGCSNCSTKSDLKASEASAQKAAAPGDIIDVATGPGMQQVTTLVTAVKAADLVATLKGPGPFTVFAPTNEAFAKLPAGTVETLLMPENKEKLRGILLYHVHVGAAIPAAKVRTMSLSTANGQPLNIVVANGTVMVNNAKVIKTDVMASNGIIHWIDAVVLP